MEFGTTIPLFFISMCCFIATPIIGFASLANVRYALKDKQLAKNILLTVLIVASIAFLRPIVGLILGFIVARLCCPESSNLLDPGTALEMAFSALRYGLFLIIPSLTIGFIIALVITVPITLFVRSRKKEKESSEALA